MAEVFITNINLYDSSICRLCATNNTEGILLFGDGYNFESLINKYLPIQVEDDGKLPRTICPGCNIQLESTIQFFELLREGQQKLRELWKEELVTRKRIEKEKQSLAESLRDGIPKFSLVAPGEEHLGNSDDIFIKILPEGNLFGSSHAMTLKIHGLEKPKRKRGRPKKMKVEEPDQIEEVDMQEQILIKEEEELDYEVDETGRSRRRRKVPERFKEAVQGKELDRILREEGAIDGNESEESVEDPNQLMLIDGAHMSLTEGLDDNPGEVIGHLETSDGNIAEHIIAPMMGRNQKKRGRTKFVCDFCSMTYKDRTRYVRHRLSHKGLKFMCTQDGCQKKFSSKSKLRLHQKTTTHEGEDVVDTDVDETKSKTRIARQRLGCDQCGKSFATVNALGKHLSVEHTDTITLEPDETIATKMSLEEDLLEDDVEDDDVEVKLKGRGSKSHVCDECNRTFNHPSSLMYHKESVHNDGRRFVCSKCDKSFTHKQLLQRHQMVHSDTRPFPCNDCGLRFKTKSNLFNHRVVHTGEKKFVCQICSQQFAHKTSLTLHLRWHKGHRPFKCEFCQKTFTQNGNLREHLRIHTNTKPYGCDHCGKFFTTSSQHKLHVKRHTGDKPWKCSHCDRSFLHKDTWRTHERRHTGEKPYHCSYCMRAFAEHWSLKKHVRLHTGEKPYKCSTCGKEFADCSNLTKHRKIHMTTPKNKIDSTVWSIIKSQLVNDMSQDEGAVQQGAQQDVQDVQEIIYVTYEEDDKTLHIVDQAHAHTAQEMHFATDDKDAIPLSTVEDMTSANSEMQTHMNVTDEDGNVVELTIDGRAIDLVSMDSEQQVIQVRTADGQGVFVQLPTNQPITEEELFGRIQQAVVDEAPRTKLHKSSTILLPQKIVREPVAQVGGNVLSEEMLTSEIADEEDDDDGHKELDLEMDDTYTKLNEFLADQQC